MPITPAHLSLLDNLLHSDSDGTFLSCPPSTVGFYSFVLGQVLTPFISVMSSSVCVCVSALRVIA